MIALGSQNKNGVVIEHGQMTQLDLLAKPVAMLNRLAATVTVRPLEGAVDMDLERSALAEHNAINGEIREVQQGLKGVSVKHHDEPRPNGVLPAGKVQVFDLQSIITP